MKGLYCKKCEGLFNLSTEVRYCPCGNSYGRYIDGVNAEYTGEHAVTFAINNVSFNSALERVERKTQGVGEDFRAFFTPSGCGTFVKQDTLSDALDNASTVAEMLTEAFNSEFPFENWNFSVAHLPVANDCFKIEMFTLDREQGVEIDFSCFFIEDKGIGSYYFDFSNVDSTSENVAIYKRIFMKDYSVKVKHITEEVNAVYKELKNKNAEVI